MIWAVPRDKGFPGRGSRGSQGVQVRPWLLRVHIVLRDRGDASEIIGARIYERPPACLSSISPCRARTARPQQDHMRTQVLVVTANITATALCLRSARHKLRGRI